MDECAAAEWGRGVLFTHSFLKQNNGREKAERKAGYVLSLL